MADEKRQKVGVFINPMRLFEWDDSPHNLGLAEDPTCERLLQYLCTPRVKSDLTTLKRRYRLLSKYDLLMHFSLEEPALIENFYKPLQNAKSSYMMGDPLGTIALCGLIAEKTAIFLHILSTSDEAERDAFEKRDQAARVEQLKPTLGDGLAEAFGDIRAIRKKYLHYWVRDLSRSDRDAELAYRAAVRLVQAAAGVAVSGGGLVLNPQIAQYLTERGVIRDAPEGTE